MPNVFTLYKIFLQKVHDRLQAVRVATGGGLIEDEVGGDGDAVIKGAGYTLKGAAGDGGAAGN